MFISLCGQMWYNSLTNNSFFDTTSIVIVYQWLVYYKSYTTSVFLPVVYNRWYIASEASNSSKYRGEEQWEGTHQWCHHIHHIHNQHFQTTERHSMFIGLSRKNLCNCSFSVQIWIPSDIDSITVKVLLWQTWKLYGWIWIILMLHGLDQKGEFQFVHDHRSRIPEFYACEG